MMTMISNDDADRAIDDSFYTVVNLHTMTHYKRFIGKEQAISEAKMMASRNPDATFFVMRAITAVRAATITVTELL